MKEANNKELINIAQSEGFDESYFVDNDCVLKKNSLEYGTLYFNEDKMLSLKIEKYNMDEIVNSAGMQEKLLELWREINNGYNPEEVRDVEDRGDYIVVDDVVPSHYYKVLMGDELYSIIKHLHKPLVKYRNSFYYLEDY